MRFFIDKWPIFCEYIVLHGRSADGKECGVLITPNILIRGGSESGEFDICADLDFGSFYSTLCTVRGDKRIFVQRQLVAMLALPRHHPSANDYRPVLEETHSWFATYARHAAYYLVVANILPPADSLE